MKKAIFKGTCTALVTPFKKSGKIDYVAAENLVKFQLKNEIDAILILGSTGESFGIEKQERQEFIKFIKNIVKNQCKLIVGAGSNTPQKSIDLINEAKMCGADACLVSTPYFNRCTQNGIVMHFKKICENTDAPIIVYNIPSRSGVNILPQTMQKLCELKNIVGLKEANGDINHILEMFHQNADKIAIYSGNDNLNYLFLCLGASGFISVASNIFPKEVGLMFKNSAESLKIHNKLHVLSNILFCEPNPIPVKYALSKMDLIENNLKLPLTKLEKQHQKMLDIELKKLGVKI